MKVDFSEYKTKNWKSVRNRIIERDGHKCAHCGSSEDEVKLQVHHLHYEEGKKAWEYPDEDLITLCKSCHAEEHGAVMPQSGWEYIGSNDLEDLVGECEWCNTPIRFEHSLFHPKWGYLVVGSQCADKLTSSGEASEYEDKRRKISARLRRFLKSPRWKNIKSGYFIDLDGFEINIWDNSTYFRIVIKYAIQNKYSGDVKWKKLDHSRTQYTTLEEAKISAFRAITDGKVRAYIIKHDKEIFDSHLLAKK